MKILDRYVLGSFIKNYLISLMVLIGMYIVLDMVFNFDELTEIRSTVAQQPEQRLLAVLTNIGSYYFYQGFLFFAQLSGIIPVVAAAFTLMRLSRFNELTAVLAAGVPLLRVSAPIIIASVVLNALLIVDQEVIIPRMIPELARSHDDLSKAREYVEVANIQDDRNSLLYAAAYFPERRNRPATLETLDVIQREPLRAAVGGGEPGAAEGDDKLVVVGKITAKLATWDGSRWKLDGATRVTGLLEGRAVEQPVEVWETGLTPSDIDLYRNTDFVELLSTEQINGLLGKPKSFGTNMLLRVKHWRFTQPLMNVILLLLCIPAVLTREAGTLKTAATKCLILAALGMGTIFLAHSIAGKPPTPDLAARWPAIMAWAPIFLWGPVAVFLLDRIKT